MSSATLQPLHPHPNLLIFPVPSFASRAPLTLSNLYVTILPFILLLLMASLARVRGTWPLRMGLLPFSIAITSRAFFGYYCDDPILVGANHGIGSLGVVCIILLLDLGLRPAGVLKVGELEVPSYHSLSFQNSSVSSNFINEREHHPKPISNGHSSSVSSPPPTSSSLPLFISTPFAFFSNGFEFLTSVRGIGWQYGSGSGLHIPPEWRSSNPQTYIFQSLRSCLWHFLVMDACNTITMNVPDLRVPGGGGQSIFAYGKSTAEMLIVSTGIHCLTGLFLVSGILFSHQLVSALAVLFFSQSPASYPPIMSSAPWSSTSLHDFWGTRWHQVLRYPILVLGGWPFQFIVLSIINIFSSLSSRLSPSLRTRKTIVDLAILVGSFTASGVIHHLAMYHLDRMPGWPCIGWFMAQSVGMIAERLWRGLTGRRVNGWWGRLWVWAWIVGAGQICIDSWYRCGFNAGFYVPVSLSPTQSIVVPLAKQYLGGMSS